MSVGTSDGQNYRSDIDFFLSQHREYSNLEQEDNSEDQSGQQRRDIRDQRRGLEIDQTHHVPLVASAIMGQDGRMVGMAIDHRLKMSDDDKELLALHEGTELPYMNDLVKNGMSPPEAYAEAHKWATARETAASIAKWGPEGHEAYKDRMRENASIASQPSDQDRHPQAHTTVYGLDEHELGYPKLAELKHPIDPMNDNVQTDAPTPEMAAHDRAFHAAEEALPFAATRALGPNAPLFGRAANQNVEPAYKYPARDKGAPDLEPSMHEPTELNKRVDELVQQNKKSIEDWEKTHPDLVKYAKALDVQKKRSKFESIPGYKDRKSTTDQLREWLNEPKE